MKELNCCDKKEPSLLIREILPEDNGQIESLIRACLIEFGWDKPGCAWEDPDLGRFSEVYQPENSKYWVVEKEGRIIGGCGVGPVKQVPGVCELQKMYCLPEARGTGAAEELLNLALEFAKYYYTRCYLETFTNMEAANKFYVKHGFELMDHPLIESEHYACDKWYIIDL